LGGLSGAAKLGIVGGVIAAGVVIYMLFKQKEEINKLRKEVQVLQATVQQQAIEIANLKQVIAEQAQKIDEQAKRIAALEDEQARQAEEIAKQAQINAALQQRIADLEDRVTRAKEGVDEIPDGEPVIPSATPRSKKSSGVRKIEPAECIAVPEIPWIAIRNFNVKLADDKVIFTWQTLAELANTGFNIKCGQKNAAGEYTNLVQINDALIPTQGNGAEQHTYSYELPIQRPIGKTYRCSIESVDTDGKAFLFDRPGPVTLATLSYFTATPAEQSVLLQFETEAELDSMGFEIYRAKPPADGQCQNKRVEEYQEITKLTERPIPATGSRSQGASYSFEDNQVVPKTTYCYGLEEINEDGTSFIHWDWMATAVAR
jgi:predicted transcriptional regulator